MKKTVLIHIKKALSASVLVVLLVVNCAFGPGMTEEEWLEWSNKCLIDAYNPAAEPKLKDWKIEVTPTHFIRLSKLYPHGKREYFAFDLRRFAEADYAQHETLDTLQLKTTGKDIIVQTYNNPKGDINSMTSVIDIPVKAMSPERIDSLNNALNYFKEKKL